MKKLGIFILVVTCFVISSIAGTSLTAQALPISYTVKPGDSLCQIAAKNSIYGNFWAWPLIYKANRDQIRDPDLIYPGTVFTILRDVDIQPPDSENFDQAAEPHMWLCITKVVIEEKNFEVKGTFLKVKAIGTSNGDFNPLTEIVSLELTGGFGGFFTTIPAGSFKQDKKGRFKFEGVIDEVSLEIVIRPAAGIIFEIKIAGEGANLNGMENPVNVTLTIGDVSAMHLHGEVTAEFDSQ
jgi:hypothetical protein